MRFPLPIPSFFLPVLLVALPFGAQAAPAPASAVLSSTTAAVGEPVTLQITVDGARAEPPSLSVDGLTIQYVGRSTQVQMLNLERSISVMFTYQVAGQREGTYTIPALEFLVNGKRVRTSPLELVVTAGGAPPGSAGGAGTPDDGRRFAFGELLVDTDKAYVGQAIPVELRMYFDASARIRVDTMPTVESEGFTIEKLPSPRQTRVRKEGRVYDVLTFKTVMTPVKAGEVAIGPARMQCTISIPRKRPGFPHMDDFFNDDFFNDPFGAFGRNKTVSVESDAPLMDVRPLPIEGQPEGFSGAIGQFTLETEASAEKVAVGEPLTLTMKISGKGNFSRIGPPALTADEGWRSYPGSETFTPINSLGLTGSKTFDVLVVPEKPLAATPGVAFSYFDPADEQYITFTSDPLAVTVEGDAISSPTPASASHGMPTQPESPGAEPAETDIHGIFMVAAKWDQSFAPLYTRRGFWVAQGVPLLGLLAIVAIRMRNARRLDDRARALAGLRREKARAMKHVSKDDSSSDEFYAAAVRVIQVETAIQLQRDPASVGIEDALAAHSVDSATEQSIRRLFATRDELVYAGGASRGAGDLTLQLREAYRRAIRTYES